jgi:hypothetical protein
MSQAIYSSGSLIYYNTNNIAELALLKDPAHFCIQIPTVFLKFFFVHVCKGPSNNFLLLASVGYIFQKMKRFSYVEQDNQ